MTKISEKFFDDFQDKQISEMLTMSDRQLNTLLLELFNKRSKNISPKGVLDRYISMYEFFCPSKTDLRYISDFNRIFFECLPEKYDAIELSPITPFGGNTCITRLSQKNILTTSKTSEVCSDATTALSLEACKRRKEILNSEIVKKKKGIIDNSSINNEVNLATSKKVLRMQQFDKTKGYLQHFGQFAAITAGRKRENFEYEKIKEHIKIWVDLFEKLLKENYALGEINVGICHIDIIEHFIRNNFVDRKIVNANSFNDFKLFDELKIDLPDKIIDYDDLTDRQKEKYKLNFIKQHIEQISNMIDELKLDYPNVNFYIEMDRKGGLGYYVGSCFHIYSKENEYYVPLCDGGIPNWNEKLMCDKKETSVVSGIGSELVLNLYGNRGR